MSRNFGLDIIRGFSILCVLIQHAGYGIPGMNHYKIGSIGVEVFFVLSGFLIGGILFKEIEKENSLKSLKTFWIRRWLRILPLYYTILILKFLFMDSSVGANIIYYFLFLQNNFYGIDFMGVSWSLVIEEWFYLFSPIFIMLLFAFTKNINFRLGIFLLFIAFEIGLRIIYIHHSNPSLAGVKGNFPFRFDSLFWGVIFVFLRNYRADIYAELQKIRWFLLGLFSFVGYIIWLRSVDNNIDNTWFVKTIGLSTMSFSIALLVPYAERLKGIDTTKWVNKGIYEFFTWTSLLTYAIYLVHPFVYSFVVKVCKLDPSYRVFLGIPLTYGVAFLVYRYFEKPILNLREKFS